MNHKLKQVLCMYVLMLIVAGCKIPAIVQHTPDTKMPPQFENGSADSSAGIARIKWKDYFTDPYLVRLIDTGLKNNREVLITLQEIEISKNEIAARKGKLLPFVSGRGGIGAEKVGRYTSQGAGDASTEIKPGKEMPEVLPDFLIGANAIWEIDIWHKLRNAKEAAVARYLSTIEGKNFLITNLVAEIANSYYELVTLDNQLDIVRNTIQLQKHALEVVKIQKQAAAANELAVKKFEGEVFSSEAKEYEILQQIKETENNINMLLARYPQPVQRNKSAYNDELPDEIKSGVPSQLLSNRPDIRQAELELSAAALDVKVARAEFYPSFELSSSFGLNAFNPLYLAKLPESLLFSLAGDLAGPLINKSAIKTEFNNANARQLQSLYNYERTIINACAEVSIQLSNIKNLEQNYQLKEKEVQALTQSIDIANELFKYARANYFEVLMTQRDALESKLELTETKLMQFKAMTNIYKALGGGWQ